jgi:hypothetical protein
VPPLWRAGTKLQHRLAKRNRFSHRTSAQFQEVKVQKMGKRRVSNGIREERRNTPPVAASPWGKGDDLKQY